jgi:hypothetical protein
MSTSIAISKTVNGPSNVDPYRLSLNEQGKVWVDTVLATANGQPKVDLADFEAALETIKREHARIKA